MLREPSILDDQIIESRHIGKTTTPLYKIFPYLTRYPSLLFLALISVLIASLTVLGVGSALRLFVDRGFSSENPWGLVESLLFFFVTIAVMAFASYGRLFWFSQLSERITADLRKEIFSSLLKQNIAFFESLRVGEIQSRLTTDTTLLQIVLSTSLPIGIRNILIILGGLGMLLMTSPWLTAIIGGGAPLVLIPVLIYGRKVRQYSQVVQKDTASLSSQLDETFSAIRTVFAFCQEPFMSREFAKQVDITYQASVQRIDAKARLTALVMILVFGAISCVLWLGGQDVLRGDMTAGQLSAFLFYAVAVAGAAGSLSEIHGDILKAAGGTERIFEFLSLNPSIPSVISLPLPSPLEGQIQFREVSFAYPSRPHHPVLQGLSFEASRGEIVAISGSSGIGKTTIFNLMMRFYEPLKGAIYLDGISLEKTDVQALRNVIGLVPQDPFLFTGSLLENIRFGKLDATEDEVKAAAQEAYADEFIEQFPEGYHSLVGEKGLALSGGQRQRIAIARAILKNPAILLLDEATSALDTESETKIQDALETLRHNRTTLLIAHRKSTLKQADRVIELSTLLRYK